MVQSLTMPNFLLDVDNVHVHGLIMEPKPTVDPNGRKCPLWDPNLCPSLLSGTNAVAVLATW